MRRLVTSLSVTERLQCAAEFLSTFAEQEILLVSATRPAADEFVRQYCIAHGGLFGGAGWRRGRCSCRASRPCLPNERRIGLVRTGGNDAGVFPGARLHNQ